MPASEPAAPLRAAGRKTTGLRVAMFEAVERHPSRSLSAVYGIVSMWGRAGLVRTLSAADGHLRVAGARTPHNHESCRLCGATFDIEPDPTAIPTPLPASSGRFAMLAMHDAYQRVALANQSLRRKRAKRHAGSPGRRGVLARDS